MSSRKRAGVSAYIMAPVSILTGFFIASLIFMFILNEPSVIPVFIIFGSIQYVCILLYALFPERCKIFARLASAFLIGSFILVLAGILGQNDFQIEGFFFYLVSGIMGGAVVHFSMAKIFGPLFFSRNWCSWGCWTGMILDLLPYKENIKWKKGSIRYVRYIHFTLSLILVLIVFYGLKRTVIHTDPELLKEGMGTEAEFLWFITGNALYYGIGIVLGLVMKDNRAFCKYICPVTVFYKTFNRLTLLRIRGDSDKCTGCGECSDKCSMGIDISKYIKRGERVKSTECIMCMRCIGACSNAALSASIGFDTGLKEELKD